MGVVTGHSVITRAERTSITLKKPAGMRTGDTMVAIVNVWATGLTFTPPSGWTQQAVQASTSGLAGTVAVFTRIWEGDEGEYTFGWGSTHWSSGVVVSASAESPLLFGTKAGSGTEPEAPSLTTASENNLLLYIAANSGGTSTTMPAGYTELAASSNAIAVGWARKVTIGASGAKVGTMGLSQSWETIAVALPSDPSLSILAGAEPANAAGSAKPEKQIQAWQVQAATSGTAKAIAIRNTATWNASRCLLGLYADNAGTPGALLGHAVLWEPATDTIDYVLADLIANVTVEEGVKYWLAVLSVGGTNTIGSKGGTGSYRASTQSTFTALAETTEWASAEAQEGDIALLGTPAPEGSSERFAMLP